MPINILYIIDYLGYGGTERQLVELIQRIDRDRFNPCLCLLKTPNILYNELEIPKLALNFKSFNQPSIIGMVARLSSFIRKNRIQIVQAFFQDPFLLSALIKPFHKVKMIGSFRDLGFWRTPVETRKMRLAYPFFSGFVANSLAVKEHFVQMDGIGAGKIKVIYNGFDCKDLQGLPRQIADVPIIGIVANLNRAVKRVEDFIRAAAQVRAKFPDSEFMVVGDGHLRDGLENLSRTLGLGEAITFVGQVANPLDYVCRFTVGVITSETEGFCNAIIEYMACGVPVVATKAGGNLELIQDGKNGFLYDAGNVKDLTELITKFVEDENLRNYMGRENVMKIRNGFTIHNMVANYENFYLTL